MPVSEGYTLRSRSSTQQLDHLLTYHGWFLLLPDEKLRLLLKLTRESSGSLCNVIGSNNMLYRTIYIRTKIMVRPFPLIKLGCTNKLPKTSIDGSGSVPS